MAQADFHPSLSDTQKAHFVLQCLKLNIPLDQPFWRCAMAAPDPSPPPTNRHPTRRHPLLLFVLITALAIGAASSLLWLDLVAQSADALSVKDTASLLPP